MKYDPHGYDQYKAQALDLLRKTEGNFVLVVDVGDGIMCIEGIDTVDSTEVVLQKLFTLWEALQVAQSDIATGIKEVWTEGVID